MPDGEALYSSGTCIDGSGKRHGSCLTGADCAAGLACEPNLVIAGAADTDDDELADPFDNCPAVSNIDQADLDRDGTGDACDLVTCGNGLREPGEQCDDGNGTEGDGCSAACLTPIGEILLFYDTAAVGRTLLGSGRGSSAQGRLQALRQELAAAERGFAGRADRGTCGQLASILRRSDGSERPPDFVAGDSAPELAARLRSLQREIGCTRGG
jgi:cysteine-rich repeat protein